MALTDIRIYQNYASPSFYMISPRIRYAPFKPLELEAHYSYIENRAKNLFKYQHRFELEANTRFYLFKLLKTWNRNRLELREIEDKPFEDHRIRHMWQFNYPVNKSVVESFMFSNELFFSTLQADFVENRAIPFAVNFRFVESLITGIYFMMQHKSSLNWGSNVLVGGTLIYKIP